MPTKKFSEFDPSGNTIRLVGLFDDAGITKNGITDPMRVITQAEYDVLNAKAPTLNATFTGITKVDQPAVAPDNAEVATVKYVSDSIAAIPAPPIPVAATLAPLVDNSTPEVGISEKYAREDHIHPTNTNLALLSGAVFSGPVKAPQPGGDDDDVATVGFVNKEIVINTTTDATLIINKLNVINIPVAPCNMIVPSAGTFLIGAPIIILNISTTDACTLQIDPLDTVIPSITSIAIGESKTLYSDGVNKWYVV